MSGSGNISPTAHYTGEVWRRNGLSHPWLGTVEGRVMYDALHPVMAASAAAGGPSLETYLLARHGVSQVIEVAAGLSPRGWRFANRYGDRLVYVEGDLPEMAARKRHALARIGSLSAEHRVVELDALRPGGPQSLEAAAAQLDRSRGLAIITEGLLGYLETAAVVDLWTRFAQTLDAFPSGRYISDLHLGSAITPAVRAFRVLLAAFVRGGVYLHFHDAAEAEDQLWACGFATAAVRPAGRLTDAAPGQGGWLANILEASTT
jgi:O-methyltransferase involved in polyketide biosynthesis